MELEGLALWSYVLGWLTCSISIIARYTGPGLAWDDAYLVFCVLVIVASKSVCHFAWAAGVGKPFSQVPPQDRSQAIFMSILSTAVVPWEFTLPKLAIVVFIQKIVPTSRRRSRTWLAACAISFAIMLCISVWQFAQCRPVSQVWDPVPGGSCADPRINAALAYTSSVISSAIDLAICLCSVPVFLGLQMSARNKATVIAAVSFGALAFIAAMVKMVFLKDLVHMPDDPTGSIIPLYMLVDLESMLLILGACMGSVFKLFKPKPRRDTGQMESSSCRKSSFLTSFSIFGRGDSMHYSTRPEGDDGDEMALNDRTAGCPASTPCEPHVGSAAGEGPVSAQSLGSMQEREEA
ncbi:hypothetical protein MCOR27_000991 [Pyricularia oryzae]|nr:hypothetical protein MCOR01_003425 [Pyricularia oryzae]KAI6281949.1 hypothetical protein MCOR26_003076 [Pyricularia oryzae]KAI6288319.1 hypothetical protein MCOR27_000991 [Pyricularia oryzae]KAI6329212.1 hypothetical protein MCOR29_002338 [Pyricularia oryzae]KAI6417765.1 hypothetical protein MCOR20_000256 [Pyricularia oryzae]